MFLKAMQSEIEELEHHGTWKVIKRSEIPPTFDENGKEIPTKILAGTWAFKIKRLSSGVLKKIKARFCAG